MSEHDSPKPTPEPAAGARGEPRPRARAREERSAGGVVLRWIDGRAHVLVIRDPYHNWGLPKGHLEEGEDARDAAVREVREETGLSEIRLGPELGTIDWFFRSGRRLVHKYCAFFLMTSRRGEPVPEIDEGITECAWLTIDEALDRIAYDNARAMVREAERVLDDEGSAIPR